VAEVVPGAGREILTAVSTAIPTLKDSINTVLASYNENVPSVSSVLAQVTPSIEVATTAPQATTVNLDPDSGSKVPISDRNYGAP